MTKQELVKYICQHYGNVMLLTHDELMHLLTCRRTNLRGYVHEIDFGNIILHYMQVYQELARIIKNYKG